MPDVRRLAAAGVAANAVLLVAVFLPWASITGESTQPAGWGTGFEPRLSGMLVLASAATGIAAMVAVGWFARGRQRGGVAVAGAITAVVSIVPVVGVLVGPSAFAGSGDAATPAIGAWLALVAAAAALTAALAAALRPDDGGGADA